MTGESLDLLCINTIRTLSIDAVQQAGEYRDSVLPPHIAARSPSNRRPRLAGNAMSAARGASSA